jgi:hypothetical protein
MPATEGWALVPRRKTVAVRSMARPSVRNIVTAWADPIDA